MPKQLTASAVWLLIATLVAATIAAAAGVNARPGPGKPAAETTPAPVVFAPSDIARVQASRLQRGLPLTGTLTPRSEARVNARVAGELVMMSVREGQAVKRGQVLARIDQTEVQARVAAREADVEAARAQLVLAQKNRSTQQALLDRNFISRNAFDATQSSHEVAEAKLRAAEAELALAEKSRGDSVLAAPFDGVIAERHARQGERVSVDAPVVTLVDLSRLELEAPLPAAQIARVKVGQAVTIRVEGFDEREFSGRIERISPATVAGTRSINVYAVIENRQGQLRGGMFAQGQLVWDEVDNALLIPATAVREEAGATVVYAIEAGAVRRKPVKVSEADANGQVQVFAGLQPGASIVRVNLGALREGAPAHIGAPTTKVN
jgi:membrane fusion protein, multidrug efflux system